MAEAALELRVKGKNIWVAAPGKLVRYDWETGNPVKEIPVQAGFREMISRGDEMLLVDSEDGKQVVRRINLDTCESRTEEIGGPKPESVAESGRQARPTGKPREMAGLPLGMPGKDLGKTMDPNKVAAQAQSLSMPARNCASGAAGQQQNPGTDAGGTQ